MSHNPKINELEAGISSARARHASADEVFVASGVEMHLVNSLWGKIVWEIRKLLIMNPPYRVLTYWLSKMFAVHRRWLIAKQVIGDILSRYYLSLFFLLFLGVFFGLGWPRIFSVIDVGPGGFLDIDSHQKKPTNLEDIRNLLFGFAAFLGVSFLILRTWIAEKQARTSEQGHMAGRLAKAVELLGTNRIVKSADGSEVSTPNFEVRLGAIFILERISQDSLRDHWQVMEILTAYIRQAAKTWLNGVPPQDEDGKTVWSGDEFDEWLEGQPHLRVDLQAILTVVGRRDLARQVLELLNVTEN